MIHEKLTRRHHARQHRREPRTRNLKISIAFNSLSLDKIESCALQSKNFAFFFHQSQKKTRFNLENVVEFNEQHSSRIKHLPQIFSYRPAGVFELLSIQLLVTGKEIIRCTVHIMYVRTSLRLPNKLPASTFLILENFFNTCDYGCIHRFVEGAMNY